MSSGRAYASDMASMFKRGERWYGYATDPSGKRTQVATGCTDERKAAKRLAEIQREWDAARATGISGRMTVEAYSSPWLTQRKELGLDWANDETRLRLHILPVIGHLLVPEVRASHLASLVLDMRKATKKLPTGAVVPRHSPRTIRNVYSVIVAMLRDAEIADLIERAPAKLTEYQLGPLHDRDPDQRGAAVFSVAEVEQLIGDRRIPPDRRMVYAIGALAGLRHGEIAGLRWRRYDATKAPLGELVVATSYDSGHTKTGAVKRVPVHPTLAAMLASWRSAGWLALTGRDPGPDDLIVPLPADEPRKRARRNPRGGGMRSKNDSRKRWIVDLAALGLRHRRGHDLRATFITLLEDAGADREVVRLFTHRGRGQDAYSGYARPQWERLCREMVKLTVGAPSRADAVLMQSGEEARNDWAN